MYLVSLSKIWRQFMNHRVHGCSYDYSVFYSLQFELTEHDTIMPVSRLPDAYLVV